MNEILILQRTLELLVMIGHTSQVNVDKARKLAISLSKDDSKDEESEKSSVDE